MQKRLKKMENEIKEEGEGRRGERRGGKLTKKRTRRRKRRGIAKRRETRRIK